MSVQCSERRTVCVHERESERERERELTAAEIVFFCNNESALVAFLSQLLASNDGSLIH